MFKKKYRIIIFILQYLFLRKSKCQIFIIFIYRDSKEKKHSLYFEIPSFLEKFHTDSKKFDRDYKRSSKSRIIFFEEQNNKDKIGF